MSQTKDEADDKRLITEASETLLVVMQPVGVTMILVIISVLTIAPSMPSSGSTSSGVAMAYNEEEGDSTATKLLGSLFNALIFLGLVLVATVILILLYKFKCLKLLFAWLIFAAFLLLFGFGGFFIYLVFKSLNIPLDYITLGLLIWNFSGVGVLAIFWHSPVKVNQAYLIIMSALVATLVTWLNLPDWTMFAILAAVSIYDLFAVLCPKGPLNILVNLAQKRDEPIPALLYNAAVWTMVSSEEVSENLELENCFTNEEDGDGDTGKEEPTPEDPDPDTSPPTKQVKKKRKKKKKKSQKGPQIEAPEILFEVQEDPPEDRSPKSVNRKKKKKEEPAAGGRGVKLGLGDFIFYSILIGRATSNHFLTVFTCFLAISTGLSLTLMLLAIMKQALPALPISIGLGILSYLLTGFILLPYISQVAKEQIFL